MLNPEEVGRSDIFEVMEANMKKYGKNPAGSTLLEQAEIEKAQLKYGTKYLNQIEKSLFEEFNNG